MIGFTFGQAAALDRSDAAPGLPGAYVFARYGFPGKRLIHALTTVPFVLPTVVVAAAFNAVLGQASAAEPMCCGRWILRYTLGGILLAHVFYNYTLVLRMVRWLLVNLDPRLEQAARTLGASPWRAFREVTLPLLLPALGHAAMLVFIFCFTSFGVVLILGGPRFVTLEVEIYRQTIDLGNFPLAAGLSLVQILFTLVLTLTYTRLQSGSGAPAGLAPAVDDAAPSADAAGDRVRGRQRRS